MLMVPFVLGAVIATALMVVLLRALVREKAARGQSQRALREANDFLHSVLENTTDAVFVKEAGTLKFVRTNRAGAALIGCNRDEIVGLSDRDLFAPGTADACARADREALVSGAAAGDPALERIHTRSGAEHILHALRIPVRDETGRARYLLWVARDVTEQVRRDAEIEALNTQLDQRAGELAAVNKELEAFAYSISHDLRAPLRHIAGYVQLLSAATQAQLAPEPRRYLDVIAEASVHMGRLMDELLAFSRLARADMQCVKVDVAATVQSAIASLETTTRGRDIEWDIHELPQVEGDPAMLKLAYTHLIGNAVKYSASRKPARIEIGAAGDEGSRSILYVRDNGVGFDMNYADRLFGVFQRLHHAHEFEGTGIGLATVQRIVARHGGRVWAEAVAGEGATFYFTLAPSAPNASAVEP